MPADNASRSPARRRKFDIVLYGASGFVGRQTVAYLAAHARTHADGLRWALAGRNVDKLEQSRKAAGRGAADAAIIVADADDAEALARLARNTKVVLSTAGPFDLYGSALVAACVEQGAHYVDITGETPWVREMIERHHAQAAGQGTRIIPFCGFDSVPSDLGAWMLMQAMQQRHGVPCVAIKAGFTVRGGVNGGTLASALNLLGGDKAKRVADPFLLNPDGADLLDPRAHADPVLPVFDADFKAWMGPFVMGPINTRVVRRSAALLGYGRNFHYQEFMRVGAGLIGGAAAVSLSAAMGVSQAALGLSPVRRVAGWLAPKPGEGPSRARMDGGSFRCVLVGRSAAGQVVRACILDQGDPGNRATTKMVCEAALTLARNGDDLPGGPAFGGVLTPASGLGGALVQRLRHAGMTLQVDP
jgi:short subunit dehydrogenase-like uncharacterized protein